MLVLSVLALVGAQLSVAFDLDSLVLRDELLDFADKLNSFLLRNIDLILIVGLHAVDLFLSLRQGYFFCALVVVSTETIVINDNRSLDRRVSLCLLPNFFKLASQVGHLILKTCIGNPQL